MLKFDMDGQSAARFPGQRRPLLASLRDLWVLAKARVVSLLVFTAAVGEILAPDALVHWESAAWKE